MKLETVKTFMLVTLIGISIILSYTLWSYQPNTNNTISGDIVGDEMDAGGSSEETKRSLIKPSKIIFHEETGYYGFHDTKDQDELFEQMQEWVITNFEVYNSDSTDEYRSRGIEILFPEEIPMEILGSLLTFGADDINFPGWSMNRVFISFVHDSKSLRVEFESEETNAYAEALISDATIYEQLYQRVEELDGDNLREYLVLNEGENPTYFPAGELELATYSITPSEINPALFVNVLFTNPSVVRETNTQTIGEVYFTDNRQLGVYQSGMRMEYISHATPSTDEQDETVFSEVDLLDRSISNVNNHSGWTIEPRFSQEYRLESLNMDRNEVTFQMYYKGYPVFSSYNLATIRQRWGVSQNTEQLLEYDRPLYSFDGEFLLRETEDLPSGETILSFLEADPSVSTENIQDVTIGYELNYQQEDQESEYFEMQPAWYKMENDNWQKIIFEEENAPRGGN